MFASFRSRLWLTYAFLIAAALSVVGAFFVIYLIRNPFSYRQAIQKLSAVQGVMLARQEEWSALPVAQLQPLFSRQGKQLQVRILLLDSGRNLLVDSDDSLAPALDLRRLARLNQTTYDTQGDPWLFNFKKMADGNLLVLAVPRPKVAFLAILKDELFPPILYGGLIALGLSLILAFGMARWVADPLQRVVEAASQFSGAETDALPLEGPQEVRELVGAFNQMTARVQATQQSQREFVANVSHELKTPLTSVQGFAQALLDGTASTAEAREQSAHVILDEAGRMHRLVLNLLDLARLEAGTADLKRVPVDLNALIEAVAGRFAPQARSAGVTIEAQRIDLPAVIGDGDRLAQVLTNLVDNALKFTPAGGRVVLQTRLRGNGAEIDVQDTGSGIQEQALPHIFDRFYQADPARPGGEKHGAGLGLSIVREIVALHGGKISVRSLPGQGSVFSIWLPLVGPEVPPFVRRKI